MEKIHTYLEELEEKAYRRGYSHALQTACLPGINQEKILEMHQKIKEWRYNINIKDHPEFKIDLEAS